MPEAPLDPFELRQRMVAKTSVGQAVNPLGDLFEIFKSHTDVKPIEDVFGFRRDGALNGS